MTDEVLLALATAVASGTGGAAVATTSAGIGALISRIRERFTGDTDSTTALDGVIDSTAEEDPENPSDPVRRLAGALGAAAEADPEFARLLTEFHQTGDITVTKTENTATDNGTVNVAENVKLAVQGQDISNNSFTIN